MLYVNFPRAPRRTGRLTPFIERLYSAHHQRKAHPNPAAPAASGLRRSCVMHTVCGQSVDGNDNIESMNRRTLSNLFPSTSPNSRDFVLLNWHDQPIKEFGLYAEAYHSAAMRLVDDYGTTGAVRDIEATPILFLYRHAFELYLKAFVLTGSKILGLSNKPAPTIEEILGKSHKLTDFIPHFEAILNAVGWTWDMGKDGLRTRTDFINLVNEFQAIDPTSSAFRYPTRKDGKGSLRRRFSFNLRAFASRIDPLLKIIDGALLGLSSIWDDGAEAAYEAQFR